MRFVPLLKKSILENIRDWKIWSLTISFAPFFVLLMYFYFGDAVKPYRVVVVNHDQGILGAELTGEWEKLAYPDGKPILSIKKSQSLTHAGMRIKNKSADLVVEIPSGFSQTLQAYKCDSKIPPVTVVTHGEPANPRYIPAAIFTDMVTFQFTADKTGLSGPLEFKAETMGSAVALDDFQLYVPGLLGLAVIMLMFTAAASFIKEKDKGTIIRLRMSKMNIPEFFTAVSIVQVIIGLLALGLTYLTAYSLGYRSTGSLFNLMIVGIVSCLAVIAISLLVAGFLRTIFDLMTIGCFPFFIMMFFSGGMFPIPSLPIFSIGERSIDVNHILPTTHTTSAFNKILNYNAPLAEVQFEIIAMLILTLLYFGAGLWLFKKRHFKGG